MCELWKQLQQHKILKLDTITKILDENRNYEFVHNIEVGLSIKKTKEILEENRNYRL